MSFFSNSSLSETTINFPAISRTTICGNKKFHLFAFSEFDLCALMQTLPCCLTKDRKSVEIQTVDGQKVLPVHVSFYEEKEFASSLYEDGLLPLLSLLPFCEKWFIFPLNHFRGRKTQQTTFWVVSVEHALDACRAKPQNKNSHDAIYHTLLITITTLILWIWTKGKTCVSHLCRGEHILPGWAFQIHRVPGEFLIWW
jgi:hypothetical protein